jgi:hypothetical protein
MSLSRAASEDQSLPPTAALNVTHLYRRMLYHAFVQALY